MITIKVIKSPAQEHLDLIKNHGELHITKLSLYHYHCEEFNMDNSVLLEYRDSGFLVAISFVSLIGKEQHSITVVHHNFRNRGIGSHLLHLKNHLMKSLGHRLEITVDKENIASIKMCSKIFQRKEVRKCTDKVIFY